ncbi:c-type cytochrome domain-containing protein [Tamlana sp. 2201CG12-4]|uniref:c-type cytochrome domain-containing protein n=1 Tax=Tamlana sp. 2201CG12-4 TaxID=3112582 RepID=UPI002DBE7AEA|nr:c-type cytochrome domain-containing protein [Tamlana sp. 2201CG12-4]MEC3907191.1 c-type cytochrome domain-containing protein [Tamlana sp. 2201CG12-4]
MKQVLRKYSAVLVLFIVLTGVLLISLSSAAEIPKIVLFFGRFHPLLLHLPIGALLLTFFIDIIGRIKKDYPLLMIKWALGFSSFFAILTCILGYFLSLEGGYGNDVLEVHFWTGILTAVLTLLLFLMVSLKSDKTNKWFLPLFVLTLVSISVAGHYGSVLTHGENFLTEYVETSEKERIIEVVDSLKIYDDVINKILDDKCVQCHNSTKKKGGLSLISKEAILKGGENGAALHVGNSNESLLYEQLLLPISHENHMPPEGKPQLTKDELWLIKYWIDNGAKFDNYVNSETRNDTLDKLLKNYLVFDKIIIPKASKNDIVKVKEIGYMVNEMVPGEAELSIKFTKKAITKNDVDMLSKLKEQIIELDFSNTSLTDQMTGVLKRLENLKMLRLDNTKISDKTLQNIKDLKRLEVLNLFNTGVTGVGLETLLKSITPSQIYTWKTAIEFEMAERLKKDYGIQIHNGIARGFVEKTKLEAPKLTPENTLFIDSLLLSVKTNTKNAELRYTLNGEIPDSTSALYTDALHVEESKTFMVRAFKKGWFPSDVLKRDYFKVKYQVDNFTIEKKPEKRYPNANKLFDLEVGNLSFKDGKWTGYLGYDLSTTINLGAVKAVDSISVNSLGNTKDWILFPNKLKVYASNNAHTGFKKIGELKINQAKGYEDPQIKRFTLQTTNTQAQYFKIIIENPKVLPKWHEGAGQASWIFVDEIFLW